MGVSTDGILFYGICLPEESYEWSDDSNCFIEEKLGLKDQSGLFDEHGEYAVEEGTEEHERRKKLWHKHKDRCMAARKELGANVDIHCSYNYPMNYIFAEGSRIRASRGYPEEVKSLEVKPEWDVNIRKLCDILGVEYEQPKWYLVSMWG